MQVVCLPVCVLPFIYTQGGLQYIDCTWMIRVCVWLGVRSWLQPLLPAASVSPPVPVSVL